MADKYRLPTNIPPASSILVGTAVRIPERPPTLTEVVMQLSLSEDPGRLLEVVTSQVGPAPGGRYRHWDTLRRLPPPPNLTHQEWWAAIKFARSSLRRELPLKDQSGRPFGYCLPDIVLEMLHGIDRDASGRLEMPEPIANPHTRDRYVQSSLIEEAITSSQLEGAATTREVAKEMIRSGRPPIDRSELMILNNYRAIKLIAEFKNQPLTPEVVFTIHRTLTHGTLEPGPNPQNLRVPGDGIGVYDDRDNTLLHAPPLAEEIPQRMSSMCDFANHQPTGVFLHPVIKAIVLHFWLAYDHPFVDGNGRTARALFYWSMLSQGLWLVEFLSISSILCKAPSKYSRSFLYTETDENDLTYFIVYHLKVIRRAIEELRAYLARKLAEVRETEILMRSRVTVNHRQLALLSHALRHPGFRYTIDSHQRSHNVSYQTARTDLLDLATRGLLDQTRAGKAFVFSAADELPERLKALTT